MKVTERGAITFRAELGGPGEVKVCLVVDIARLTASRERTLTGILSALPSSIRKEVRRQIDRHRKGNGDG